MNQAGGPGAGQIKYSYPLVADDRKPLLTAWIPRRRNGTFSGNCRQAPGPARQSACNAHYVLALSLVDRGMSEPSYTSDPNRQDDEPEECAPHGPT